MKINEGITSTVSLHTPFTLCPCPTHCLLIGFHCTTAVSLLGLIAWTNERKVKLFRVGWRNNVRLRNAEDPHLKMRNHRRQQWATTPNSQSRNSTAFHPPQRSLNQELDSRRHQGMYCCWIPLLSSFHRHHPLCLSFNYEGLGINFPPPFYC